MEHSCLCRQGDRPECQDRYYFNESLVLEEGMAGVFCGVYDGHGTDGAIVAQYAREHLHESFVRGFEKHRSVGEAFKFAYEEISAATLPYRGGTVAANYFLTGGTLFVANAGDCRIVTVGEKVCQHTLDHVPTEPGEKARLEALNVFVQGGRIEGEYGRLSVSRNLGYRAFKECGVIAEPRVCEYVLLPTDRATVIASDGLFGKVSNEEVAQLVQNAPDVKHACDNLWKFARERFSGDDITIVVVML